MSRTLFVSKIFVLIVIAMLVLTACQPAAPAATEEPAAPAATEEAAVPAEGEAAGGTITLPFMGPLTGPDGADGQGAAKAGQLAVDLANKAGGICGGKQLVFKPYDTKADPKEGANIASLLATDESIYAVISDYNSSVYLAAKPVFADAKIPQISYYTTATNITEGSDYAYRIYPPGENMAIFFINVLAEKGVKKIAQVYENEDYGQILSKRTADEAAKVGIEVVASEPVLKDQTDVSAVVAKIKAAEPEVIVGWVQYTVGSFFVKQAAEIGLTAPLYGHDGLLAPDFIKLAGPNAEGVYTLGSYNIESTEPVVANFVKEFGAAYSENPNNPAGYVWDDATIIIKALNETNCAGREAVKKWLDENLTGKPFQGVTGTITLDENRDRTFAPGMYTLIVVKDGKFVPAP